MDETRRRDILNVYGNQMKKLVTYFITNKRKSKGSITPIQNGEILDAKNF